MFIRVFALLTAAASPEEVDTKVRQAMLNLTAGLEHRDDYSYLRYTERKEFGSDGKVRSRQSWKVIREDREGYLFNRLLERDDKPIPPSEQARIEESIQARLAEMKGAGEEQRAAQRKKQRDSDAWIREFPDALQCRAAGEERIDGRDTIRLDCTPRPSYQPKNSYARVFTKLNGRMWLDKKENEIIRAEAETYDSVNVGWGFLGHIEKGTRFRMDRARLPDGGWQITSDYIRFNARILLVKSMNQEASSRYWDYKPRSSQKTSHSNTEISAPLTSAGKDNRK